MVGVNGEKYNDREAWAPVYYPGVRKPGDAKWIQLGRGETIGEIELRLGEARRAAVLRILLVFADGQPVPDAGIALEDLEGEQRGFLREGSVATVYVGESYRVVGSHYEERQSFRGQSEVITITGPEASVRVVLLEEKR